MDPILCVVVADSFMLAFYIMISSDILLLGVTEEHEVADWTKSGHKGTCTLLEFCLAMHIVTMYLICTYDALWYFNLLLLEVKLAEDNCNKSTKCTKSEAVRKGKERVLQVPTQKEQYHCRKNVKTVEAAAEENILSEAHDRRPSEVLSTMTYPPTKTVEAAAEEIILSEVHDLRPSEVSSAMTYLPTVVKIHHSAYMEDAQWDLVVKCKDSWDSAQKWKTLSEKFPKAIVRESETSVIVKIPSKLVCSPTSFIVVGTYGPRSYKRMQVALFGGKPVLGKNWVIKGCLIDDDYSALKVVCEAEEKKENHLLVQPRLLLVSNAGKSIEFALQFLSKGWTLLHSSIQCMEPNQVWDFWSKAPGKLQQCSWTIQHEDKNKQYLDCQINVKQGEKSTYLPVLEYFKEEVVDVDENFDNNDPSTDKEMSKDEKNARFKSACELSVTRKRKSYPIV